jgi:hypothetical protein
LAFSREGLFFLKKGAGFAFCETWPICQRYLARKRTEKVAKYSKLTTLHTCASCIKVDKIMSIYCRGVKEGIVGSKVKGPSATLRLKKKLKRCNQVCPESGRNPLREL